MTGQPRNKDFKHNYLVNVLDGGFFGFSMSFASFTTIIPLFVASLTTSATLIGLIPAIHTMGWQLPQLLTVRRISKLPRYRPFVLATTIHERIPFLGLAVVAWLAPKIGSELALVLVFALLIWQGLGGGIAANPWQNMIGKVIPSDYLATFFGIQSSAANLLASAGAVAAGYLLETVAEPYGFTLCFLFAGVGMMVSLFFISLTREDERPPRLPDYVEIPLIQQIKTILRGDANFRNFLLARILSQFGLMSSAFYVVYAVEFLGMSEYTAGVLTSVLFFTQVIVNPVLGRLADRWNRKHVLEIGAVAMISSALLAWWAPNLTWFYLVFIFTGIANTVFWSVVMAFTLSFGTEDERPTYVGLANTLIAPSAILAPLLGGWLADYGGGYQSTFLTAASAGLITLILLHFLVKESRPVYPPDPSRALDSPSSIE